MYVDYWLQLQPVGDQRWQNGLEMVVPLTMMTPKMTQTSRHLQLNPMLMEEVKVGGFIRRLTEEVREDSASCGPGNRVDGGPSQ